MNDFIHQLLHAGFTAACIHMRDVERRRLELVAPAPQPAIVRPAFRVLEGGAAHDTGAPAA